MATDDQVISSRRGAGGQARVGGRQLVPFVVAANGTLSAQVTLPLGSWFRGVTLDTPVAISGTPTSCLLRVGTAAAGQQVVADVDAKSQGHISATIVAAFDKVGSLLAADTPLYLQLVTSGATAPAGTIYAFVDYDPPVF